MNKPLDSINARRVINNIISQIATAVDDVIAEHTAQENTENLLERMTACSKVYLEQLKDKNVICGSNLTSHKYDSFTIWRGKYPKLIVTYSNGTSSVETHHRMRSPSIRRLKMYARRFRNNVLLSINVMPIMPREFVTINMRVEPNNAHE